MIFEDIKINCYYLLTKLITNNINFFSHNQREQQQSFAKLVEKFYCV